MPKVAEARFEVRRDQILDAAMTCFARKGFHQTTMADIAREAGITPGAIYRYFGSKEDVVEASAQARRRARAARFQAAQQRGDALQILDELVDRNFKRWVRPDASMRLGVQLFGEALQNARVREAVRGGWDDALARFVEIIRLGQARGEINPALDARSVGRLLLAVGEGFVVQKTVDPDADVWRYAEVFKALLSGDFWRGQRPDCDGKN